MMPALATARRARTGASRVDVDRPSAMLSRPRARATTTTSANGRSMVPAHTVIGSPAPSSPAGIVPSCTDGAISASANSTGASTASTAPEPPHERPRTNDRAASATSGAAVHERSPCAAGAEQGNLPRQGAPDPPLRQPGTGDECGPGRLSARTSHGASTATGTTATTSACRRTRAAHEEQNEGEHHDGASSTGAKAPSSTAASAVAKALVAVDRRAAMSHNPQASGGSRTSPTRAPTLPWATDAAATPVVAHANAARARTHRVLPPACGRGRRSLPRAASPR